VQWAVSKAQATGSTAKPLQRSPTLRQFDAKIGSSCQHASEKWRRHVFLEKHRGSEEESQMQRLAARARRGSISDLVLEDDCDLYLTSEGVIANTSKGANVVIRST
jgi:hypothetical protein